MNQPAYAPQPLAIGRTSNGMNTSNKPVSRQFSSSNVFGIVLVVIVIMILLAGCYWLYQFYTTRSFQNILETEVMPDVKDAAAKFNIGTGSIPSSNYSNEYSISMWLNIDNYTYNYGKEKPILRRGDKGSGNPEIVLGDKTNDLIVRLKLQVPSNVSTTSQLSSSTSSLTNKSQFANVPSSSSHHQRMPEIITGNFTPDTHIIGSNLVNYLTNQIEISNKCTEDLAKINLSKISDNSPPPETQKFKSEFFADISGNHIPETSGTRMIREKFDNVSDISNALADLLLNICSILKMIQSQTTADNSITIMNTLFESMIYALETKNATSGDDIAQVIMNTGNNDITMANSMMPEMKPLLDKLISDFQNLQSVSATTQSNDISLTAIQNNVNARLSSASCPIILAGATDADMTSNLFKSILQLLKKSLYTYINNLGAGVRKEFPDIGGVKTASCLVSQSGSSDPSIGICVYKALPLQRWVHVVVSVYNQVVDLFIDGQLASSCVMSAFPALSTSDVLITPDGGFAGKIARVKFSNMAMTAQHARKLYYDGPVASAGIFSMIPNWVWYGIIFLIIIAIGYSFVM